jgi:hypothetical protein
VASNYPAALDSFTEPSAPTTTALASAGSGSRAHFEHHRDLGDAVEAVQTELGTDPAGGSATVRARLDAFDGVWPPSAYGLISQNYDIMQASASLVMGTAGTMYLYRLWIPGPCTITNALIFVTAVGVTLTSGNNRAALFDSAGNLYSGSITADQSVAWVSTGLKEMALGTPVVISASTFVDVGWWWNGSTAPTLARTASGVSSVQNNIKLTGNDMRIAQSSQTGLTSTAPSTTGTKTAYAQTFWAAVS